MMSDITNSGTAKVTGGGEGGGGCPSGPEPVAAKPPEECRSGDLPHEEYHQAAKIGEGAYGSITTVYDDEGEQFALKTFEEGEDSSADQGTLREISILRLLRGDNAHRFIIQAHDFYVSSTDSSICMVMPKAIGSLMQVLDGTIQLEKKGGKPRIAHQVLSSLAFLHDNGIMHRDVKPDNVLLNAALEPILCDFSLAKFVAPGFAGATHSGDVGTAVYMAPEVYQKVPYGVLADAYSAGVMLLELFQGSKLTSTKDKQAQKLVAELRDKLPDRPIGELLRGLTAADPAERTSCRAAIETNKLLVSKFGKAPPSQRVSFPHAMDDHCIPKDWQKKIPKKVLGHLNSVKDIKHPITRPAAVMYYLTARELDDSVTLGHCLILAAKMYEPEVFDLEDTESVDEMLGDLMDTEFDVENYAVDERTVIEAMDFNLLLF